MPSARDRLRWNKRGRCDLRPPVSAFNTISAGTSTDAAATAPAMPLAGPNRWWRDDGEITATLASLAGLDGDPVQFHAVIDEPIAEPGGNPCLQFLDFGIVKFDDLAGFDIDQMVVMLVLHGFIA